MCTRRAVRSALPRLPLVVRSGQDGGVQPVAGSSEGGPFRRAVVGVLFTLALVGAAACGGGGSAGGGEPNPGALFPERANQFREDQERALGEAARLSGYTTAVEAVSYDGDGTVTVSVRIENREDEPQPMFSTDWQLVSPEVTTYEPLSSTLPSTGEVADEPVTGDVVFEVDALDATGDFYVVYKPDRLDAARGIWQFPVPDGSAPAEAP